MIDQKFWHGKRVFITGHSGFKGSWMSIWLQNMGAIVCGYSLSAPTSPSLFVSADVAENMHSIEGDIRQYKDLYQSINEFKPEIVFHMAAQPLVRLSYDEPVDTYSTNVMGTVNLLEAVRHISGIKVVVNITSDKCYENKEWLWGYRENEPMGGYDPYSNSKGCAELVTSAYRSSYFNPNQFASHGVGLATVRAGNVIGGGDWAADRLIPDILKAFEKSEAVIVRNPHAIRPWQHVLEPLSGYLLLAQYLYANGSEYSEGWNFGPNESDATTVAEIVELMVNLWGDNAQWVLDGQNHPHEAHYLKLDCSKAKMRLNWSPCWDLKQTLERIVTWHKAWMKQENMFDYCIREINDYMNTSNN